jgi:hypothetical protein
MTHAKTQQRRMCFPGTAPNVPNFRNYELELVTAMTGARGELSGRIRKLEKEANHVI